MAWCAPTIALSWHNFCIAVDRMGRVGRVTTTDRYALVYPDTGVIDAHAVRCPCAQAR